MATHTETHGGTHGRKFAISRENGLTDKNGRPYFFEYLPQLPANTERRKFETRPGKDGNPKHYELFSALDGFLIGVDMEAKAFNGTEKMERWLVLTLIDAEEEYRVEVGQIDGRYSMDIMKRLLDPNFDPRYKLRVSPYAITDNGKTNIGLSAISGTDSKLTASKDATHLAGIPQPETVSFKGETKWDFTNVALWLYEQVKTRVCPRLMKDPISAPQRTPMPTPTATHTPQPAYQTATADPFPTLADAPPVTDDDQLPF